MYIIEGSLLTKPYQFYFMEFQKFFVQEYVLGIVFCDITTANVWEDISVSGAYSVKQE